MTTIILNNQEKTALLQLIDIAVKSGGIAVAEAGVVLYRKIAEAQPLAPQVPQEAPPAPQEGQ